MNLLHAETVCVFPASRIIGPLVQRLSERYRALG